MRDLEKNKETIYAKNFLREDDNIDADGYYDGTKTIVYSKRFEIKTNISGAKGQSQVEIFGTDVAYDKIFVLTRAEFEKLKLTENSVFFVDTKDKEKYDYQVARIAKTINQVVIAIKKVKD